MIKLFYFWLLVLFLKAAPTFAADLSSFSKLKARSLDELLNWALNATLVFLAPLALLAIIWSGILYLTSMGDAAKAEQAKKNLTWAVIGLILVIGFWAILNFVVGGLR